MDSKCSTSIQTEHTVRLGYTGPNSGDKNWGRSNFVLPPALLQPASCPRSSPATERSSFYRYVRRGAEAKSFIDIYRPSDSCWSSSMVVSPRSTSASPRGTIWCESLRFVSPTESDRAGNERKGVKRLGQASDICVPLLSVMTVAIVVRLGPFGRVWSRRRKDSPWTDTRCGVQIGRFGVIICGRRRAFLPLIASIIAFLLVHLDIILIFSTCFTLALSRFPFFTN